MFASGKWKAEFLRRAARIAKLSLLCYTEAGDFMKEYSITANDAGQRLDRFVKKVAPSLPASLLQRYIRIKRIKVNGKRAGNACSLREGDVVTLYINDEFFPPEQAGEHPFLAAHGDIRIVYEDENLLLADKDPGLVVHEDAGGESDTLIARIQKYLYNKGEYDPAQEASFAPALCNRIDRNTGGIVIAAKNAASLRILNDLIRERLIKKRYLCIVHGRLSPADGTLRHYLRKDEQNNRVTVYDAPRAGARTAITKYRVLRQNNRFSLVEAELLTGRTHQIRAQMAHIGHPLLGDAKYGLAKQNAGTGYRFQALWSYQLTFDAGERAGPLAYLNGRTFTVENVPLVADFDRLGDGKRGM